VLIIVGVFVPLVVDPFGQWLARHTDRWPVQASLAVVAATVVLAVLGVIVGTGWIMHTTGRVLRRFGGRPAMLLAGRQLMADPWAGSRIFAALLAGVIVGAGALGYRIMLATQFVADEQAHRLAGLDDGSGHDVGFYLGTIDLISTAVAVAVVIASAGIMVALAEGIVARRRAYAALVATGVPRRILGEAVAWQTLAPLVPALLVALTVGLSLVRVLGTEVSSSDVGTAAVTLRVPVPLGDLAVLGGGVLAAMLAVVVASVFFLRSSTDLEELRVG
jgi:hypothetical protein